MLELRAEVERKASLIELYQSRDNPRERFSPCVGEIKAVQRRLSAEAVEAAGELQAARAALEDSEERAASRRAELEARLESARQDAFHAQTQGQAARPSPPQQSVGCVRRREGGRGRLEAGGERGRRVGRARHCPVLRPPSRLPPLLPPTALAARPGAGEGAGAALRPLAARPAAAVASEQ